MSLFDATRCALGEGAFWHPERQEFFWFDILNRRLYAKASAEAAPRIWSFKDLRSAAGWISREELLVASESGLWRLNLETGAEDLVAALEAENPVTRSNDGRADPWGGFWIGTMGKAAEKEAGSIWRLSEGRLERLFSGITISNAICFDAARACAYFADTALGLVWRQPLAEGSGAPKGEREVFLDLRAEGLNPDGAVTDAEGNFWSAQWGAGRVACYDPRGRLIHVEPLEASHVSCPAFGGADFSTLFVTSALQGLPEAEHEKAHHGRSFAKPGLGPGTPEPRVRI